MRKVFVIMLLAAFMLGSFPALGSAATCEEDKATCVQLLDEATAENTALHNQVDSLVEDVEACKMELDKCDKKCGWVAIAKDKTLQATVIASVLTLVGGVVGIFAIPH